MKVEAGFAIVSSDCFQSDSVLRIPRDFERVTRDSSACDDGWVLARWLALDGVRRATYGKTGVAVVCSLRE